MLVHQVGKASDRSCGRVLEALLCGRDATAETWNPTWLRHHRMPRRPF